MHNNIIDVIMQKTCLFGVSLNDVVKKLEKYLYDILAIKSKVVVWNCKNDLPLFLLNTYEFYEIALYKQRCLLMVTKKDANLTPAIIEKHRNQILLKWPGLCIYVQATITFYNRQRLIAHHIPFIVPGNQMYLPNLGIDFREYFQRPKVNVVTLSFATQAVIIFALTQNNFIKLTPAKLAKDLNYSRMTLTRAFNELEATGIGKVHKIGRERTWTFEGKKRDLWEQTQSLLHNPIKNRVWIRSKKPKIKAGLSALDEYSTLNPPEIPVYATSTDNWITWKASGLEVLPISEGASSELEIWHYNPELFTAKNVVDPFSLYLSLKDSRNERIETALEEMMENIKW